MALIATMNFCLERSEYTYCDSLRADEPGVRTPVGGGGRDFPYPSKQAPRSIQAPVQEVTGLFPRVDRPERGVNHPSPSSAETENGYS